VSWQALAVLSLAPEIASLLSSDIAAHLQNEDWILQQWALSLLNAMPEEDLDSVVVTRRGAFMQVDRLGVIQLAFQIARMLPEVAAPLVESLALRTQSVLHALSGDHNHSRAQGLRIEL